MYLFIESKKPVKIKMGRQRFGATPTTPATLALSSGIIFEVVPERCVLSEYDSDTPSCP